MIDALRHFFVSPVSRNGRVARVVITVNIRITISLTENAIIEIICRLVIRVYI